VHKKSLQVIKTLVTLLPCIGLAMYRRTCPGQLLFENFDLPFGGKLSSENWWVKLVKLTPWEEFEQSYSKQFSEGREPQRNRFAWSWAV